MRETITINTPAEVLARKRRGDFAPLSFSLLAGIYRGFPQLVDGPHHRPWESLLAETREFADFEVSLFESDGEGDTFADGTAVAGLSEGKKALVRREIEGEAEEQSVSEAVVDLNNGHFAVNSPDGTFSYNAEGAAIEVSDLTTHQVVSRGVKRFINEFVAATPDYDCPRILDQAASTAGAAATTGARVETAVA